MNQSEIIAGNKLIAEFMGYIDNGCSEDGFLIDPNKNHDVDIRSLKYHSSWDWLMPVLIRMDNLESTDDLIKQVEFNLLTFDLEHMWETVVDFINWYNQQN